MKKGTNAHGRPRWGGQAQADDVRGGGGQGRSWQAGSRLDGGPRLYSAGQVMVAPQRGRRGFYVRCPCDGGRAPTLVRGAGTLPTAAPCAHLRTPPPARCSSHPRGRLSHTTKGNRPAAGRAPMPNATPPLPPPRPPRPSAYSHRPDPLAFHARYGTPPHPRRRQPQSAG